MTLFTDLKNIVDTPKLIDINNFCSEKKYIRKLRYGSGSKDVSIHNNKLDINNNDENYIIQEFIDGDEYSVEVFCENKNVYIILISKREINQNFSVDKIYVCKNQEELKSKIFYFINNIYEFYQFPQGPGHIEIIIKSGKVYLIDLAFRGGGYEIFNFMVYKATGFNIIKNTIKLFTYQKVKVSKKIIINNYVVLDYIRQVNCLYKFRSKKNEINNVKNFLIKKYSLSKSDLNRKDDSGRIGVIMTWNKDFSKCQQEANKNRRNLIFH